MASSREFETLYIVAPELSEDDQKKATDSLGEAIVKAGGEIIKTEVWGRRKLAYTISRRTEGVYVLVRAKGGSNVPKDIDTYIKRTPAILRHLNTVVSKQQLAEEARQRELSAKRAEDARKAADEAAKREAEAAEARAAAEAQAAEAQAAEAQAAETASETEAQPEPDSAETQVTVE
jgi:small subunit ribosomal protein S6